MITPKELLEKTQKSFFKIVSSELRGEVKFPWVIPSNKKISGSNFSDWKNDLVPLYHQSKQVTGFGYSVNWKEKTINGSKQSIPTNIFFESIGDYVHFVNKRTDYKKINEAFLTLSDEIPSLSSWAKNNPKQLLLYYIVWKDLIKVCKYLLNQPPPHNFYVRELPLGVHSKFIEDHSRILIELLDIILPKDWINNEKDFALRYGFKKPSVHTHIRILDEALKPTLGYGECSIPLDDASWLQWTPKKVFIIENQVCYLTFPKVEGGVAIFGEGFKSKLSKHISWLAQTELFCWFDLDAAGFEMLNMIRQHYPEAKSFLMDSKSFETFQEFAVENKVKKKKLEYLEQEEADLYDFLTQNNKRLEQEKIGQQYVISHIPN